MSFIRVFKSLVKKISKNDRLINNITSTFYILYYLIIVYIFIYTIDCERSIKLKNLNNGSCDTLQYISFYMFIFIISLALCVLTIIITTSL